MGDEATTSPVVNAALRRAMHLAQAIDQDLYCPKLERLLMCTAAELGYSGNLGQVVAAIERGGSGGGAVDNDRAMVERVNSNPGRGKQLALLEQEWRLLPTAHQAIALAHYLGTPRAHPTIREHFGNGPDVEAQQGSLAGVVLYRWQVRKAKGRERTGAAVGARLREQLEIVRAQLAAIEVEFQALAASQPAAPAPTPPTPPYVPLVLSKRARREARVPYVAERAAYHEAMAQHTAVAEGWLAGFEVRVLELGLDAKPLEAEQAHLCALLADVVAGPIPASSKDDQPQFDADELALVQVCRSGKLDKAAHVGPAENEVRAMHRAWRLARRQTARRWVESDEASPA